MSVKRSKKKSVRKPAASKARKKTPALKRPARGPVRARQAADLAEHGSSSDRRVGYYNGRRITYCVIGDFAIYQGDINIGKVTDVEAYREAVETPPRPGVQRSLIGMRTNGRPWPGGVVPYEIESGFPAPERVTLGMDFFSRETTITFVPRQSETNYLIFKSSEVCHSEVGMQTMPQEVHIAWYCEDGNVAHEICHALGLEHEQKRADRDTHVTIKKENIKPGEEFNFDQTPSNTRDFGAYDYNSIMHYSRFAFSGNGLPTIIPKPNPLIHIGQRDRLSPGDLEALNTLYPAPAINESSDAGPAIATRTRDSMEELLLAWKGNGNDGISLMLASSGGLRFGQKTTLTERSNVGPALAYSGGRYFLAWAGAGNNKLNVMQSEDGRNWTDKITLPFEKTRSAPAIAAVGLEIFLAWRGTDDQLNLMRSFDGRIWSPKITLSQTSKSGPALCAMGPTLLLAWRGVGNNRLNVMASGPGGALPGPKKTLNETTDARPALAHHNGTAVLSWRGEGNHQINTMASTNGQDWFGKRTLPDRSLGSAALTAFGSSMVMAWTEESPANSLRVQFMRKP